MAFTHQGHWDVNDPLSDIRNLPFPVAKDDGVVTGLRAKLQAEQKQRALRELDAAIASRRMATSLRASSTPPSNGRPGIGVRSSSTSSAS